MEHIHPIDCTQNQETNGRWWHLILRTGMVMLARFAATPGGCASLSVPQRVWKQGIRLGKAAENNNEWFERAETMFSESSVV